MTSARGDAAGRPGTPGALLSSRRMVLVAGAALLLSVLLTLAGLAWYERGQLADHVHERNALLARVLAEQATRNVESAALAGTTLAKALARGLPPDGAEARNALEQMLVQLPYMRGMAIVDGSGRVRGSADAAEVGLRIDLAALGPLPAPGRELLGPYVAARRLGELARRAGDGAAPAKVGFLPLLLGVPSASGVAPHDRLVVVGLLNPAGFATFQETTLADDRAAAALVTYGGQLVAATASVQRAAGSTVTALAPFRDFLPGLEQGSWTGNGLRDGAQLAAFRVSATRPLVVLVEFSRAGLWAEWTHRVRWLLAAAVAAVLLIGAMTRIAARSVGAREAARAERDLAQAEVARSEHELRITIQSLQELIFRTDAQGCLSFANQRWSDLAGAGAVVDGQRLWELVLPQQRAGVRALFAPGTDRGAARRLQATFPGAQGGLRTYDVAVIPLFDGPKVTGYAGSAVDITERLAAKQRLRTQLAFTELLMDVSPMPCSVMDMGRRYVLVNKAWEAFTGRSRAEVIGQPAGAHLSAAERQVHETQDRLLRQTGDPQRYDAVVKIHDGSFRDVVVNKLLLPGEGGQPAGILSVLVDVTEFHSARDAAEEASRTKSEFIANISHELRTPLQTIIGFSELGLVRSREQPKLTAMFHDIHGAGQRMLALVNDLLDVAKIESTVGTIHLERADLRGLVREVLHELQPLAARRRLQLSVHLPPHPLRAKVDPRRFQQVLRNVLANAIKFSPDGGAITIRGEQDDRGELHLSVADQGPGIPEAERESIFEAFVQSSQTKDGSGGTGLGLAICRKLMSAHGGRITAQNRPGGGSVFHLHLPENVSAETMPATL